MPITHHEVLLRLAASIVLGGMIGYERERREQPAGLRTHVLVALASATFMIVSSQFVFYQHYANDGIVRVDVGRIASNVVVGIGFLGGGAILHAGLQIKGLTTAASLWLVASVGLASGGGMFALAALTAATALLALVGLRVLERNLRHVVLLQVSIETDGRFVSRGQVERTLGPVGGEVQGIEYARDRVRDRSRINMEIRLRRPDLVESMVDTLQELPSVRTVRVRQAGK